MVGFRIITQLVFALSVLHVFNTLWVINFWFIVGFFSLNVLVAFFVFCIRSNTLSLVCIAIVWTMLFSMAFDHFPECIRGTTISYFVITIPRNKERFAKFEQRMQHLTYTVLPGFDAKSLVNMTLKGDLKLGNYVFMLGFHNALRAMLAQGVSEWVLLFEDDAYLYEWSLKGILGAACHYQDADMIWLDMRGAVDWFFAKTTGGGMAGTLFKRASLERMIDLMNVDGPEFNKSIDTYNPTGKSDDYLSHLCSEKKLKCALSPMVRESGDGSSHV